jgi:hypothetical protein
MVSVALRPDCQNLFDVSSLQRAASNFQNLTAFPTGPLDQALQTSNRIAITIPHSYTAAVRLKFPDRHPLRFRVPSLTLRVSDEDQDGVFVVTDTFSRVYGEGEDDISAIKDYLASLLARFLDLERHEDVLAPGLREDLEDMRRFIVRVK